MSNTAFNVRQANIADYRAAGIIQFLQLTDRIIGRSSRIVVEEFNVSRHGNQSPAYTTGSAIYIDGNYIRRVFKNGLVDKMNLIILKGLNYHELAHVLYSPRTDSKMFDSSNMGKAYWMTAWNILEDARIERMFGIEYPMAVPYFNLAVSDIIVKDGDPSSTFFLIYGRHSNLANQMMIDRARTELIYSRASQYQTEAIRLIEEWKVIADEYLQVVFPSQVLKAISLVTRASSILYQINNLGAPINQTAFPNDLSNMSNDGQQPSKQRQQEAADKIKQDAESPDEESEETDATGDDQAEDQSEDQSDDEEAGESSGSSSSPDTEDNETPKTTKGHAVQVLSGILKDDQMLDDIKSSVDSINSEIKKARTSRPGQTMGVSHKAPSAEAKIASSGIVKQFERLRVDLEPTWLRKETRGRLNLTGLLASEMNDSAALDFFDLYDTGDLDRADGEIYLSIDASGSMADQVLAAAQAAWSIKKACDKISWPCTVEGWSSWGNIYSIYDLNQKAGAMLPAFDTYGSTDPQTTLQRAVQTLVQSPATSKSYILFTDGEFTSETGISENFLQLRKAGIVTTLIVQEEPDSTYRHHLYDDVVAKYGKDVDSIIRVNSVADCVGVAKNMINRMMARAPQAI